MLLVKLVCYKKDLFVIFQASKDCRWVVVLPAALTIAWVVVQPRLWAVQLKEFVLSVIWQVRDTLAMRKQQETTERTTQRAWRTCPGSCCHQDKAFLISSAANSADKHLPITTTIPISNSRYVSSFFPRRHHGVSFSRFSHQHHHHLSLVSLVKHTLSWHILPKFHSTERIERLISRG